MAIDYIYDDSWLNDLKDDVTNLDFSYDPSTAGTFNFNPDAMVFDDMFDTSDAPSLWDSFGNYNEDSGEWLTDLEQRLDNPFDFSYDPSTAGQFDFNVDDMVFDDDADFLKDLYPSLFDPFEGSIAGDEDEYQGIFGLGIGPKLNQFFTGGQGLASILTGGGGDGKKGGGSGGLLGGEGLLGGSGLETLIKLAMINKLRKQDRDDPNEVVPIGSDAFSAVGGGQGLGSMPDYRIFNLQPALMPGVGYANAPPPGMKDGGLTGLSQKIGEGIDNYAISPYLAEVGFFEDPSFAKYVEGARLYNQTTKAPGMFKSVAPFIDDSFEALRDGYEAFLKSFKEKRGLGSLEEDDRVRTKTLPDGTVQFLTGMKDGGLKDGPGDITLARLEPGEFVMTRKATDNIGAKNLYRLMKEAERMG